MYWADIEVGKLYAIREGRASLTDRPIHKVKVVAKLEDKKRPRVRYLEGEREGLEEFVRTSQFLAKWADVKKVLRDEKSLETLRAANASILNDVVWEAITAVIFSTGETTMDPATSPTGSHRIEIPTFDIQRIEERFGLEPLRSCHRAAYVDRNGSFTFRSKPLSRWQSTSPKENLRLSFCTSGSMKRSYWPADTNPGCVFTTTC